MTTEDKRWEGQELNWATESKFPEVVYAGLFLTAYADKRRGKYIKLDQAKLDELVQSGALPEKARGVRIDRLCLYYRLFCRLGPGGDDYPVFGVMNFYSSESVYAIFLISPKNDSLQVIVLAGEGPS